MRQNNMKISCSVCGKMAPVFLTKVVENFHIVCMDCEKDYYKGKIDFKKLYRSNK